MFMSSRLFIAAAVLLAVSVTAQIPSDGTGNTPTLTDGTAPPTSTNGAGGAGGGGLNGPNAPNTPTAPNAPNAPNGAPGAQGAPGGPSIQDCVQQCFATVATPDCDPTSNIQCICNNSNSLASLGSCVANTCPSATTRDISQIQSQLCAGLSSSTVVSTSTSVSVSTSGSETITSSTEVPTTFTTASRPLSSVLSSLSNRPSNAASTGASITRSASGTTPTSNSAIGGINMVAGVVAFGVAVGGMMLGGMMVL